MGTKSFAGTIRDERAAYSAFGARWNPPVLLAAMWMDPHTWNQFWVRAVAANPVPREAYLFNSPQAYQQWIKDGGRIDLGTPEAKS